MSQSCFSKDIQSIANMDARYTPQGEGDAPILAGPASGRTCADADAGAADAAPDAKRWLKRLEKDSFILRSSREDIKRRGWQCAGPPLHHDKMETKVLRMKRILQAAPRRRKGKQRSIDLFLNFDTDGSGTVTCGGSSGCAVHWNWSTRKSFVPFSRF